MTMFECLLVAHLVGDWLLQTEHEAMNKTRGHFFNSAILKHCATYTLSFVPVFLVFPMSPAWLILVFASHWFLDRRWPVVIFIQKVKFTSQKTIDHLFWLVIAVDQVLHILVIVGVVALERLV